MPICAFIPRASLASIVIGAVIFNIDLKIIGKIWQTSRLDLVPYLATLLGCLFWRLEYGILLGIGINLAETLYVSTLPMTHFDVGHNVRVKLNTGSYIYPAANNFRNALEDQFTMDIENCYNDYVLDFTMLNILDYTTLNSIIVRPFSTFNSFFIMVPRLLQMFYKFTGHPPTSRIKRKKSSHHWTNQH